MITPEPRLVGLTTLVALGAAVLYALDPQAGPVSLLALLALGLACTLDALRAVKSEPVFSINLPAKAAWLKGLPVELVFSCTSRAPRTTQRLRVAIPWPDHVQADDPFLPVTLTGDQPVQLRWTVVPCARGVFSITNVYGDAPSPWGLWRVRHRLDAQCTVQVHANLLDERHKSASLFLHRRGAGSRIIRQVGRGREFEQLREYLPGDSFEDIFWKGTARRGYPVTKTYQLEQVQEIYTIIDASRLSARGFGIQDSSGSDDSYLEHFITTTLLLSAVAGRQHDRFGLVTFSEKVNTFLRAGSGRTHFNLCRDALTTTTTTSANPDFEELFIFLRQALRRRALLVFLTSLDDPVLAEQFCAHVHLLSRTHLVLVCMMTPAGVRPVFSGTPPQDISGVYSRLAGHLQWQQLRELQRNLSRQGVNAYHLEGEHLCSGVIEHYLNVKKRQLL